MRTWADGWVGYVNGINEPTGSGKRQLLDKIMTLHTFKISSSVVSIEDSTKRLSSAALSVTLSSSFINAILCFQTVFTKRTSGHRLGKLQTEKLYQFAVRSLFIWVAIQGVPHMVARLHHDVMIHLE
jgi:hypothetical protein